jgi:DNA-binding HxlR family transcriptional regulator
VYTAIQVIEGRWKPMICRRLGESGPLGFGELRRAIPGVTAKVLRQQLRQMEAADCEWTEFDAAKASRSVEICFT